MDDRMYYLGFSFFTKIGPAGFRRLQNYFGSLASAYISDRNELEKAGLSAKIAAEYCQWRKDFDLDSALSKLEREGISFLTWNDPDYPRLLSEITAAPPLLYYKGTLKPKANRLAIVGSRRFSAYAQKSISFLMPDLVSSDIEIVSGLALGVDAIAHQDTLNGKGTTLAVLGSGLAEEDIYPYENRTLAKEIIARNGALISEFPPGTPPYRQNFPQRNRIISGLSQAVLVIECAKRSGALITANFALEQNREVLSLPGNIFSSFSEGPNHLIKCGARPVTKSDDILEIFNLNSPASASLGCLGSNNVTLSGVIFRPSGLAEELVYAILRQAQERAESVSTDEIIKQTGLDTSTVNSTLSMLEIAGVIENSGSGYNLI